MVYSCFSLLVHEDISLEINCFCLKSSVLLFPTSTILSIHSVISSFRAPPEVMFTNFFYRHILNGFSYSCSIIFVTCDTISSDILIGFGPRDKDTALQHHRGYSVVDSSNPVNLWSSLIDVGASDLSRKQFLRNMIL